MLEEEEEAITATTTVLLVSEMHSCLITNHIPPSCKVAVFLAFVKEESFNIQCLFNCIVKLLQLEA